MALYLTKSRFKLALECPTKLYYANPRNGYFDKNRDNDFLQSLADGGNQVGELAKFKYHPDPVGSAITVEALDYEKALADTEAKLSQPGRVVIAEAALRYETFFVRVDILIADKNKKVIDIIEVKSKSVGEDEIAARFKGARGGYKSDWLPYLYDVTFQAEVARLCFPGYLIRPKLLLLDANYESDLDGLHQHFKVLPRKDQATGRDRIEIVTPKGLTKNDLGSLAILKEVEMADIVDELRITAYKNSPHIPLDSSENLSKLMQWFGYLQDGGIRHFGGVSKQCKSCQFRAPVGHPQKSGVHECWKMALEQGMLNGGQDVADRSIPLSIDIWGGGSGAISVAQKVIDQRRAFLSDIQEEDIKPNNTNQNGIGMTALERRMAQVQSVSRGGASVFLNEDRLDDMDTWDWPLHMIDFETSAPAIPFFKSMRSHETIAFQFSHHIMEKSLDGKIQIRHANQWISTKAETFPSIEFVRSLRKALMPAGELHGTVFRYHNHENTVLRNLRALIEKRKSEIPDAEELIQFIDLITKSTKDEEISHEGAKQMVDLHRLIQEGFYSAKAGGSISLKFMLPAILHVAPHLADLYREKGVYGQGLLISSLNFSNPSGHIWLKSEKGDDPYKTLPAIFGPDHGEIDELLFRLAGNEPGDSEDGTINQGGIAMTSYNYTQYACLKEADRKAIEASLLRYCELDTLAMVMLIQGLMELRGKELLLQ
jgi:Domain of unknown function(DUF2779)